MPALFDVLSDPALGRLLAGTALGAGAVALFACAVAVALRRRDARLRQAVLHLGLGFVLLAPLAVSLWSGLGVGGVVRGRGPAPVPVPAPPAAAAAPQGSVAPAPAMDAGAAGPGSVAVDAGTAPGVAVTPASALLFLWLLGAVVSLGRLGLGQLWLARFRSGLCGLRGGDVCDAVAAAARDLGVTPPPVFEGARLGAPLSIGVMRPALVFPAGIADRLRGSELRAVVLHEVAHLRERHHVARLAQCLARALHWWNPLVLLLDRLLRGTQEEVCDDHAVARTGDRRGFARCLVALAEGAERPRFAAAATGLLHLGGELERRVRDLMRDGKERGSGITAVGAAGLAVFTLCAGAVQAGLTVVEMQDKANHPRRWLPLKPGATWKWRFKVSSGSAQDFTWRCLRRVEANRPSYEVAVTPWGFVYWAVDDGGIYEYRQQHIGRPRGVRGQEPQRLVPGPIGATTRWRWTELGSVQLEGRGPGPTEAELTKHFDARIESMADEVTVPAGTYSAVRIRIEMKSDYFGTTIETLWLVRDVGIVKRVIEEPSQGDKGTRAVKRRIQELLSFTPGTDGVADVDARLRTALQPVVERRGAYRALQRVDHPVVVDNLVSVFYIARWKDGFPVVLRHHGGRTVVFRPSSVDDWKALVAEEGVRIGPNEARGMTQAYGVLWALCGSETAAPQPRGMEGKFGPGSVYDLRATIRVTGRDGRSADGFAHMRFEDRVPALLESNLVPQEAAIPDDFERGK